MKRTMVLSFILTVVMVAFEAEAQITVYRGKLLNPDRTGPMVIAETDQIGRTLKTATVRYDDFSGHQSRGKILKTEVSEWKGFREQSTRRNFERKQ